MQSTRAAVFGGPQLHNAIINVLIRPTPQWLNRFVHTMIWPGTTPKWLAVTRYAQNDSLFLGDF